LIWSKVSADNYRESASLQTPQGCATLKFKIPPTQGRFKAAPPAN